MTRENVLIPEKLMSIGELLDRAIGLTVRWFFPMFAIVAGCAVPGDIFDAVFGDGSYGFDFVWLMLASAMGHTIDPEVITRDLTSNFDLRMFFLSWAVTGLTLFSFNAAFIFANAAIERRALSLFGAYRVTWKIWMAQFVLCVVYTILSALVAIGVLRAFAAFSEAIHGSGIAHDLAVAITFVTGVPLMIAGCAFLALLETANNLSSLVVAVEHRSWRDGLFSVLRTMAGRRTWRRSVHVTAVCMLIFLCTIAAEFVLDDIADWFGGARGAERVVYSLIEILMGMGGTFLFVLFYRDLQTRFGGADLLWAAGSAPGEPRRLAAGDYAAADANAVGP